MKKISLLITIFLFSCHMPQDKNTIRIAQFNIFELSTEKLMQHDPLGLGNHPQLLAAAEIIRRIQPDILIINELDQDYTHPENLDLNARRFQKFYLSRGHDALSYDFIFTAPCNTGILSGYDLDKNGVVATEADINSPQYAGDCYGWGKYPGQYSMAVFSRFPMRDKQLRSFQKLLWKDLPGNHILQDYYTAEEVEILRLSSKSHWDLPLTVNGKTVHLLLSHPTPPVFDGPEDRNGRRNFDELKLWWEYLNPYSTLTDDQGQSGGLPNTERFIIAGDLNASASAQTAYDGLTAIQQLLEHPRVKDSGPFLVSAGAAEGRTSGAPEHVERATASWHQDERQRIDYILPDLSIQIIAGGVFWPASSDDRAAELARRASDHHLLWLDIRL